MKYESKTDFNRGACTKNSLPLNYVLCALNYWLIEMFKCMTVKKDIMYSKNF